MCGIFGLIPRNECHSRTLLILSEKSQRRGSDASGLFLFRDGSYKLLRSNDLLMRTIKVNTHSDIQFVMGHSRLVTNSEKDNQPINYKNDVVVIHNGIIVNDYSIWQSINQTRSLEVDTEVLAAIVHDELSNGNEISTIPQKIFELCEGAISAAIAIPKLGKLLLLSNTGDLYFANSTHGFAFASESTTLIEAGFSDVEQLKNDFYVTDIPSSIKLEEGNLPSNRKKLKLLPSLEYKVKEESLIEHRKVELLRCLKCILPETMPFITFDENGLCNYCINYKAKIGNKSKDQFLEILDEYKKVHGPRVIIPFSGGRDSSYTLHTAVQDLGLDPITFTYDWGMVTDLARRNISRMTAKLGVENILVAADIEKKRSNIKKNLTAWLKSPHLGMLNLLTAGDKHFFKYADVVRRETGVNLQIWGINPLETTHFKSGFLGIAPNFMAKSVYLQGITSQLHYQSKRFKAMGRSPGYFNSSLWDTLSGEYYRSIHARNDYYELFDYFEWNESLIDRTLEAYNWETASDTSTTWRVGDGTAAFYNYVYHTVAGFSEHDTFRSNQIRERAITRDEGLILVSQENMPRYENMKWYLDAVGLDFGETIKTINAIPKLRGPITSLL
jgi:glucosamine--fructose-6-phosphate aminotransferase (isomerizing)